jgi:hypothetical protein
VQKPGYLQWQAPAAAACPELLLLPHPAIRKTNINTIQQYFCITPLSRKTN